MGVVQWLVPGTGRAAVVSLIKAVRILMKMEPVSIRDCDEISVSTGDDRTGTGWTPVSSGSDFDSWKLISHGNE